MSRPRYRPCTCNNGELNPMLRLRLIAGWEQAVVAIAAGVSISWYRMVESYPQLLTLEVAEKIARVLKCSAADLMPKAEPSDGTR